MSMHAYYCSVIVCVLWNTSAGLHEPRVLPTLIILNLPASALDTTNGTIASYMMSIVDEV